MLTALQRPIGTNSVHFDGAGFVPDVRLLRTDVQGEPNLFTELMSLFHRFRIRNEMHPQAVCEWILQCCGKLIGFTVI